MFGPPSSANRRDRQESAFVTADVPRLPTLNDAVVRMSSELLPALDSTGPGSMNPGRRRGLARRRNQIANGISPVLARARSSSLFDGFVQAARMDTPAWMKGFLGNFYDLQSTAFVLDRDGRVVVSVYSSGAIGRLVPEDVVGLVRHIRDPATSSA
jgi:hypothetical protein